MPTKGHKPAAKTLKPLRDPKTGRILPGSPPIPGGGRPKGLAAMVRDVVDFAKLTRKVYDIAMDPHTANAVVVQAAKLLYDRGWGQAPATLRVQEVEPAQIGNELARYLSDDELAALERAHAHLSEDREALTELAIQ
jgi:hypothetical protein